MYVYLVTNMYLPNNNQPILSVVNIVSSLTSTITKNEKMFSKQFVTFSIFR